MSKNKKVKETKKLLSGMGWSLEEVAKHMKI